MILPSTFVNWLGFCFTLRICFCIIFFPCRYSSKIPVEKDVKQGCSLLPKPVCLNMMSRKLNWKVARANSKRQSFTFRASQCSHSHSFKALVPVPEFVRWVLATLTSTAEWWSSFGMPGLRRFGKNSTVTTNWTRTEYASQSPNRKLHVEGLPDDANLTASSASLKMLRSGTMPTSLVSTSWKQCHHTAIKHYQRRRQRTISSKIERLTSPKDGLECFCITTLTIELSVRSVEGSLRRIRTQNQLLVLLRIGGYRVSPSVTGRKRNG